MIYKPKDFTLDELLPPEWMDKGPEDHLWGIFDFSILRAAQVLRDRFGPIFINNWAVGGPLKYCGFRPEDCGVGSILSQHKFGRALDLHPTRISADEMRHEIKSRRGTYSEITCIEEGVSWVHIDCRNYDGLLIIN